MHILPAIPFLRSYLSEMLPHVPKDIYVGILITTFFVIVNITNKWNVYQQGTEYIFTII